MSAVGGQPWTQVSALSLAVLWMPCAPRCGGWLLHSPRGAWQPAEPRQAA